MTIPSTLTAYTAMTKLTKATIVAKIQENSRLSKYKARKGLKAALFSIIRALGDGKKVDMGKLGKLVVVDRAKKRVIRKNLKGRYPSSVVELHKKHPKSVRLVGGKDMSDDPQPTIVHKKQKKEEPDPAPARSRHIAIAFPAWRRRHKFR